MNEQYNPWTILNEKEIYSNPWISVTEFDVLNPLGGKGIYGKVHFKNKAIAILPIDESLNTYLVGQYRFPINQYSWEIPEGGGLEGIDILESAKRELKEETGLVAKQWIKLMDFHLSNSVSDEVGIIYLALQLEQQEAMPEETEQLVVRKIPFKEACEMVDNGLITDSLSVAAILKTQLLLVQDKLQHYINDAKQ